MILQAPCAHRTATKRRRNLRNVRTFICTEAKKRNKLCMNRKQLMKRHTQSVTVATKRQIWWVRNGLYTDALCVRCTGLARPSLPSLSLSLFPALSLLLPCAGNWIAISSGKRRHNWEIKTTLQRLCLWVTVADKDIQRITAVPNTSGLRHHNSRRGERERENTSKVAHWNRVINTKVG